jgi:CelD/BcsL family acetyltransferase involved in cellulose biosynthesis
MPTTSATSTTSTDLRMPEVGVVSPRLALRRVPAGGASEADLAAWSDLAARAIEPNPFFEPGLLAAAAAFYGGVDLGLIESEDGRLLGALPLRRAHRWRRIPAACLSVWRHPESYLGTPLLAPEAPVEALGALVDHSRTSARAGLIAFEWLGTGGPVEAALREACAVRGLEPIEYETFERASLVKRLEPDYLKEKLSKGRARELRRLRRQLGEQLDAPLEVTDRTGDPQAVEDFLTAEAGGWKGAQGDAFLGSPAYADFFRDVCARFAADGRLQLLVLSGGGVDVAWKVNLVAGDAIFCFKIAYAEQWARFSPGVQLELDFVEIFHGTNSTWSDSCAAPDNEMINRLWPDRRSLATLLVPTGGVRGAASRQSARTAMAVRRRIRRTDDQAA